jgi:MarR family transcriptional regulator for hemolysin
LSADFELSHASAWPIVMISRLGDGARPGQVADAVGIEPPSLVRIIDQLVNGGLVLRQDDPSDRRAKTLSLTAAGKRIAERLERRWCLSAASCSRTCRRPTLSHRARVDEA